MSYRRYQAVHWEHGKGWRCGHRGFFFFPPVAMLFGFFVLFMLFKSGLWILLLIGGLIFWAMRHRYDHKFGGWEKRKHGSTWHDWQPEEEPRKAKHDDYI